MNKNLFINTSFHNDVINLTYDELVERIGEPTYGLPSGDILMILFFKDEY